MIGVIREHRPDAVVALSSFYDLENRPAIAGLNADLAELSVDHRVLFIDAAGALPREPAMAYDYGHFTPQGDALMGRLVYEVILPPLRTQQARRGTAGEGRKLGR
jgi:hypothetical protein